MKQLSITVPLTPPGVNHYVKHTRSGRHYVTKDAATFKQALFYSLGRGECVIGESFLVEATVYLAAKQKGDVDGFPKLILDGLADAGVFMGKKGVLSDAHVTDLHIRKRRDVEHPRTEITVKAL